MQKRPAKVLAIVSPLRSMVSWVSEVVGFGNREMAGCLNNSTGIFVGLNPVLVGSCFFHGVEFALVHTLPYSPRNLQDIR